MKTLSTMAIMAQISFSAKDVRNDLDWSFKGILETIRRAAPTDGNFHWQLKRRGRMAILTIYQKPGVARENVGWQAYKVERTLRGLRRYNLLK